MTTTCQQIVDLAKAMSPLNNQLANDRVEMLSRISADQQELFTVVAGMTRDRFQTTASATSSGGSSGRVFDLSGLVPPVERVLLVTLGDGRNANQVDILDIAAELSPRYIVRGQTLVEVANDWATATGGVTATIVYVYGMTAIDISKALSQLVTVPDVWIDLLTLPLAMYFHQKDPGRDPDEYTRLATMLGAFGPASERSGRRGAFLDYLENYGGVESRRFIQPSGSDQKRK